jgi:hypothetical protein
MKMICFTIVLLLISSAFSFRALAQCKPDPEGKGVAVYYSNTTFGFNMLRNPNDVSKITERVNHYKNDEVYVEAKFHFTINGKELRSSMFHDGESVKATFSTFEAGWLLNVTDGNGFEQFYLEFASHADPCIATIQQFVNLNK